MFIYHLMMRVQDDPVWPEELMERAEAASEATTSSGTTIADLIAERGLLIGAVIGGLLLLFVILGLLGRMRRRRDEDEELDAPLFSDGFEVREEPIFADGDDQVEIKDINIVDPVIAGQHADAYDAARDDERDVMDTPLFGDTVEVDTMEPGDEVAPSGFAAAEAEASPAGSEPALNVVPLRARETETEQQPAPDGPSPHHDNDREAASAPIPRYAFGGAQPRQPQQVGPGFESYGRETFGMASGNGNGSEGGDNGQPFVAPFIREDIDRSERRQSERVDALREEFSSQFNLLKSEQSSRLDLVISAIDRKLESLDRRQGDALAGASSLTSAGGIGDQVGRLSTAIEGQGQRIRAITQILESRFAEVTRIYDEVKTVHDEVKSVRGDLGATSQSVTDVGTELDAVREHVGRLERALLDRAAQDNATTVRLNDVIRGSLPEGTYAFGATLENGENADCVITFDGLRDKVAVDAGFPMAAFHELPSRDAVRQNLPQAKQAEEGFRRAILRAILEAADRCIAPGETVDSCLLFLPSEAAYTILHDRFPDLVRDSQRARVWLVSPSTLMGTLTLIRNLLPDQGDLQLRAQEADEARMRREEEDRLKAEVTALRRRASSLADELDRTRGTVRDLISSTEKLGLSELESDLATGLGGGEDVDGMIEGLRFDGTPEWSSGSETSSETSQRSSGGGFYGDDRFDTRR